MGTGAGASTGTTTSRPPSAASTYARPTAASRASAIPAASSTATGVKRKTRATSSDAEKGVPAFASAKHNSAHKATPDPAEAKRPALSSAFSAHVAQTSLNRQLLAAQAQATALESALLEKQGTVDRLEADLRLMAAREEEEREARRQADDELAAKTRYYEAELASAKKRLTDLEADHEDLGDAYSSLSHSSQSQAASLRTDLAARDQEIALLESQRNEAEERARERENERNEVEERARVYEDRVTELENFLEEVAVEEESVHDSDYADELASSVDAEEGGSSEIQNPLSPRPSDSDPDSDADADAEGEVDAAAADDDDMSITADFTRNGTVNAAATPTPDTRTTRTPARAPPPTQGGNTENNPDANTPAQGESTKAYTDPGAPPPYSPASSPLTPLSSTPCSTIASSRSASAAAPASPDQYARIRQRITRRLSRARLGLARALDVSASRAREQEQKRKVVRTELARQHRRLAELEAANAHLKRELERVRARAEGTELLREEKRVFERQAAGAENLRRKVAELEEAAAAFARKEKEWEVRLREGATPDENAAPARTTPVGVTQQLTALRKAHAALLDEHGRLKADLRTREVELADARADGADMRGEFEQLQEEATVLRETVARREKDRTLLAREVTFLKSLVTSYKNEEAVYRPGALEDAGADAGGARAKLEQRVVQLETLLSEYKATIETLEGEVDRVQRATGGAAGRPQEQWDRLAQRASLLEEALGNAQTEARAAAARVEALEQRLFELGGEIGGGRHVPPGTRVLSLRENPAQAWADTREAVLARLKNENEALLARLKELEAAGGTSASASAAGPVGEDASSVPRASWEAQREEAAELRGALAQREKRLLRLQEVFTAKSAEFRDAIAAVLGLKLAFYPNGQVRVTSVYDLGASFVFQPAKARGGGGGVGGEDGAKMQLIAAGEGGPQELDGLMKTWIREEMCIPCFMASVTLECYDKWKSEQAH
ncbi:mitotic checkpoint protein-domain-containing protein [Phellopilus nigrolimitatus]|nr:mitotic checkpoint protein-domain-containing protein [Phellopilus nigrolimitatus]